MSSNPFVAFTDRLGHKPSLFINKQERDTTGFGTLLTIILGIGIITTSLFYFIEFFMRQNLNVVSKNDSLKSVTFDYSQRLFMINFFDSNGKVISDRIAQFKLALWNYDQYNNTYTDIELSPCSYDKHSFLKTSQHLLTNINISHYLCIDPNAQLSLNKEEEKGQGSYMVVYLAQCDNSTIGKTNHCASQTEIDHTLNSNKLFFTYIIDHIYIDHFNYSNPISSITFAKAITLTPAITYDYSMYYKHIEYRSDDGWLFSSWNVYTGFQFDESLTEKVIHLANPEYYIPNALGTFLFWVSSTSDYTYERTYPKLQIVLANISALIKVFFVACDVIVNLIATGNYYVGVMFLTQKPIRVAKYYWSKTVHIEDNKQVNFVNSKLVRKKVNPCVSCTWMIIPKLTKRTVEIEMCKLKVSEYLSVEAIINKLMTIEIRTAYEKKVGELGNNSFVSLFNSNLMPNSNNNLQPSSCSPHQINVNRKCNMVQEKNK